jgi:phage shock protein A
MDLLQKSMLFIKSNLHGLLDRAVNTPEAVAQLIRELEEAIDQLAGSVAEAQGNVTGLERDITQRRSKKLQLESDADLLMTDEDPTNNKSALELQAKALDVDGEITDLTEQLSGAQTVLGTLRDALDKLNRRHSQMLTEYHKMRLEFAGAQAKERAAAAITMARDATGGGADDTVDNIGDAIRKLADTADARLAMAMGGFETAAGGQAAEDVRMARAKQALLARQHQVTQAALEQAGSAPAGTPAA